MLDGEAEVEDTDSAGELEGGVKYSDPVRLGLGGVGIEAEEDDGDIIGYDVQGDYAEILVRRT